MFKDLVESSGRRGPRGKSSLFVSAAVHAFLVIVLIVIPLVQHETLPAPIAYVKPPPLSSPPPSPPSPPATPPPDVEIQKVVKVSDINFVEPRSIPTGIPEPMDDIPDIYTLATSSYGLPQGIPGGEVSAIVGYQTSDVFKHLLTVGPPPPPPEPKRPIRIGGTVQTSKLIRRIAPDYPPLARQARIEGMVLLQVLVDETGNVAEVSVIRGHSLLIRAAVEAVRQWKYSATLLNDEPVPVIAAVTVNFVLN